MKRAVGPMGISSNGGEISGAYQKMRNWMINRTKKTKKMKVTEARVQIR